MDGFKCNTDGHNHFSQGGADACKKRGEHPLDPVEPWHTHVGMSDQEIRARALECSVRWLSSRTDALEAVGITDEEIKTLFWGFAKDFETYIKTGEKG